MIRIAPIPENPNWQPADRDAIERSATYAVECNDGVIESWSGALLYIRMRPEFIYGRAVRMAKIEPEARQ